MPLSKQCSHGCSNVNEILKYFVCSIYSFCVVFSPFIVLSVSDYTIWYFQTCLNILLKIVSRRVLSILFQQYLSYVVVASLYLVHLTVGENEIRRLQSIICRVN